MVQAIPYIWTIVAVIGVVISIMALRFAALDVLSARVLTNGRRRIAIVGFSSEVIRVVIHALFFGIGVWYIASGSQVTKIEIAVAMLTMEMLIVAKTALQYWLNRYLYQTSLAVQGLSEDGRDPGVTLDQQAQNLQEDQEMGDHRRELPSVRR